MHFFGKVFGNVSLHMFIGKGLKVFAEKTGSCEKMLFRPGKTDEIESIIGGSSLFAYRFDGFYLFFSIFSNYEYPLPLEFEKTFMPTPSVHVYSCGFGKSFSIGEPFPVVGVLSKTPPPLSWAIPSNIVR